MTDTRRSLDLAPLQVDFTWMEDRWTHEIRHADLPNPVVRAECADPPNDRPECLISPAYQEITAETDSPILMLIGRAGAHYHSAVVSRMIDGFRFDVANRCSLASPRVSATYLLDLTSSDLEAAGGGRIAWRLAGGRLILAAEPSSSLSMAEAGRRCTRVQIIAETGAHSRTQRLAYRWEWSG